MGKYYVPDEHGNYQEYESRADYERQQDEALNGCIQMYTHVCVKNWIFRSHIIVRLVAS